MKNKLAIALAFFTLTSTLYAADAKVLPWRTIGFSNTTAYFFSTGAYRNSGNFLDYDNDSVRLFSTGFALGYGMSDWITPTVQWIPGITLWSEAAAATGITNSNINNAGDISIGAKIQIIGQWAPLRFSALRFAIEPGVIIPLTDPPGMNALASGAKLNIDYVFNDNFFVNLHFGMFFHPLNGMRFHHNIEFEPVFSLPISTGIDFSMGLPINFKYSTDQVALQRQFLTLLNIDDPQFILSINPNISMFFKTLYLPLELKLQKDFPLLGRNALVRQSISLQINAFFPLPQMFF